MQSALKVLFPNQCVLCGGFVEELGALCGACWRETPFTGGLVCDVCGLPLVGDDSGQAALCDDCIASPRPWRRGRAALVYRNKARSLVMALKHGDRLDLAKPAARWMARAGEPLIEPGMLAVPVPAHHWRLFRRRYNQAAVLAHALARIAPVTCVPDALVRRRNTRPLDGLTRDQRHLALQDAIVPHPRRGAVLKGRKVLLIDDVLTSGATLGAAAEAARSAGAEDIFVLVLARVAKDA